MRDVLYECSGVQVVLLLQFGPNAILHFPESWLKTLPRRKSQLNGSSGLPMHIYLGGVKDIVAGSVSPRW